MPVENFTSLAAAKARADVLGWTGCRFGGVAYASAGAAVEACYRAAVATAEKLRRVSEPGPITIAFTAGTRNGGYFLCWPASGLVALEWW
jgi:hypothetical protein